MENKNIIVFNNQDQLIGLSKFLVDATKNLDKPDFPIKLEIMRTENNNENICEIRLVCRCGLDHGEVYRFYFKDDEELKI